MHSTGHAWGYTPQPGAPAAGGTSAVRRARCGPAWACGACAPATHRGGRGPRSGRGAAPPPRATATWAVRARAPKARGPAKPSLRGRPLGAQARAGHIFGGMRAASGGKGNVCAEVKGTRYGCDGGRRSAHGTVVLRSGPATVAPTPPPPLYKLRQSPKLIRSLRIL